MLLLPAHCDRCSRSFLVGASVAARGTECPTRHNPARLVPGPSYRERDMSLFEHLSAAVRSASLTAATAATVRAHLNVPLPANATNLARLNRLVGALPSLALVDAMIHDGEPQLRKAEGMLIAMLDAHTCKHS